VAKRWGREGAPGIVEGGERACSVAHFSSPSSGVRFPLPPGSPAWRGVRSGEAYASTSTRRKCAWRRNEPRDHVVRGSQRRAVTRRASFAVSPETRRAWPRDGSGPLAPARGGNLPPPRSACRTQRPPIAEGSSSTAIQASACRDRHVRHDTGFGVLPNPRAVLSSGALSDDSSYCVVARSRTGPRDGGGYARGPIGVGDREY